MPKSKTIFALRAKGTEDQFLSRIITDTVVGGITISAAFSDKGQEFTTKAQALKRAAFYTFMGTDENAEDTPWPKLEVVSIERFISEVEDDSNCDLTHAIKFIRETNLHHYGAMQRFVLKAAGAGKTFKYIAWAKGNHAIPEAASSYIVRNSTSMSFDRYSPGETIIGIVNDTDLIYIKMHIDPERIVGIWDYMNCKPISHSDLIKVF